MKRIIAPSLLLLALVGCAGAPPNCLVDEWEQGFLVASKEKPDMTVFIWFYEWHLFDAVLPGLHTHGPREWSGFERELSKDRSRGSMEEGGIRLSIENTQDGADLLLSIRNESDHAWPELAAIIPCFNPGPNPERYPNLKYHWNPAFVDEDSSRTWFVSKDGLALLPDRSIHFNARFRPDINELRAKHETFPFDFKWPTSETDATEGLIIRESMDGQWVTGIGWERSLSSQGHNPWKCMHLSIRVGPLNPGESREVKGKVYLFRGTKEDCFRRYLEDFGSN